MNKSELIEVVAERAQLSKAETERVINTFIKTVMQEIYNGNEVSIAGFGSYKSSNRAARTGRNPRTGEALTIAASRTPVFRPAKAFKDQLNA